MNPLDYIIKKAKGIVESGKKSLFKDEIGQSKWTPPVISTPYTPPTNTYKSPSSLSYTQPKPFNAIDTVIQKTGGLLSKDYVESSMFKQSKLAGDELAGVIRKPIQAGFNAIEASQPLNVLNNPIVSNAMVDIAKRTSGTGIQAAFQAYGPEKTFEQTYSALREKQAGDPSKWNQFLYQLKDSTPQTAIGVALAFVNPALAASYWTSLSSAGEIEKKGKVESLNPVIIDVALDSVLGNSIEAMLKSPVKSLWKTLKNSFLSEGGTEVSQDILKLADEYQRAKTPEEKQTILAEAKNYFKSGQVLNTFVVGGLSGAAVGTGGYALSQSEELYRKQTPGERQAGKISTPLFGKKEISEEDKSLLAVHNINSQKLSFADKTGGIANPSIGIVDLNKQGLEGYGDISLIGASDLVDPQKMSKGKTFGADIYSPRYPTTYTKVPFSERNRIEKELSKYKNTVGDGRTYIDWDSPERTLENSDLMKAKFLDSKGIKFDTVYKDGVIDEYETRKNIVKQFEDNTVLTNEFLEYIDDYIESTGAKKEFFAGYTPSGYRKMKEATAENASKIMNQQELQGGEGFFYGLGNIRAKAIKKYGNLKQIKQDKGKIVTTDEFDKIKETFETKLSDIQDKLKKYSINNDSNSFIEYDRQAQAIGEYIAGDESGLDYKFKNVPESIKKELVDFRKEIISMPTEYFEAKYKRPVKISEFRTALVPNDINKKTIDILSKNGITDIYYYDPKIEGDRLNKLRELSKKTQTAFKLSPEQQIIFDKTKEEIQARLNKIFGRDIPLQTIIDPEMMSKPNALGEFSGGIIKLLEENGSLSEVVANHEGWHWFRRNLSKKKRAELKKLEEEFARLPENKAKIEALRKAGYREEDIPEELMADHFAEYTRTGKTFSEKIKLFFDRLWNTLKTLFSKKGEVLREFRNVKQTLARETAPVKLEVKPVYNLKEARELTTRLLQKLEGRVSVSKQFISDLTNSGDMKQVEKDLIRQVLETEGDTVDVAKFTDKVVAELLPLKTTVLGSAKMGADEGSRYESIVLPEDIRGNIADYAERIYQSPIKTSAGEIHFSGDEGSKNYFGHTRVEDMSSSDTVKMLSGGKESVRRIIEVQSDLYQKGNLERETKFTPDYTFRKQVEESLPQIDKEKYNAAYNFINSQGSNAPDSAKNFIDKVEKDFISKMEDKKGKDISKLKQYNDPTAHFRMVREEIKKAAQDGKTKLQFPTGETAMKIEGLGVTEGWEMMGSTVEPEDLQVGLTISQNGNFDYVVTEILGDGKFKAVPKEQWEKYNYNVDFKTAYDRLYGLRPDTIETFDISGKVDTSNPIYKFYEKDLGKYLKNNYNSKLITDNKGVTWYEIDVKPEMASQPVTAFKLKPESVSLKPAYKQISPIDTLIAQGKIKLKSKDGRDIYQYKKGNEWVNARDESSAIAQVTKIPNKKDFGIFKKIDINNPQEKPYISNFADDFETKKSQASGLTYSTLDKISSLNTALKQKGFKGVSSIDFKGIYSLDKIIDNPILFDKYPKLKEVNVTFIDFHTPTQKGVHINNDIFLNSKLYSKDKIDIESTLVHEIEHVIQDIEGKLPKFSQFEQGRGMNNKEYAIDLREQGARKKQQEYLDSFKPKIIKELPPELQQKQYELEVRREVIENSPLNFPSEIIINKKGKKQAISPLASIMNVREGEIRELGDTTGKVSKRIEDLMGKAGYEDPTKFKEDLERFVESKKSLKEDEKILRQQIAMEKGKKEISKKTKVVFRGTKDGGELRESMDTDYGPGFYFADKKSTASAYGNIVKEYIVDLKNPLIVKDRYEMNTIFDSYDYSKYKNVQEYLRDQGYDGIIVKDGGLGGEKGVGGFKIAFDRSSVKENIKETPKPEPILAPKKDIPQFEGEQGEVKSLELVARERESILDGEVDVPGVSLNKIISNTVTPVEKKVGIIDTFLRTPDRVMKAIGFGQEAKELRSSMDEYWKELPKNIEKINEWRKSLPAESNERIFKFLDGQAITLNAQENKVAGEIRVWLKNWAKRLGLAEDRQITDYITRIFDQDSAKEFNEELAKLIADKIPGSVYNPFLLKRLGAKGYKQDTWLALSAYTKRATRKVHMDPILAKIQEKTGGSLELSNIEKTQFKYIQNYVNNINLRPSDLDEAIDTSFKKIFRYKLGGRPVNKGLRIFRQATFRGMLGLNPGSALRNLSQGINTYATLGEKYTAIGYTSLLKKGAMKELEEQGVLNAGFIQDKVLSATGKAIEKVDKVLFAFFDTAEKINRGSAYFGAKSKALAEGKTEAEAIEYAKEIVRKTQFVFDVIDTPVGLSSDIMKTMFQFQTFTTKQIEFLTEMAKDKNMGGLFRYVLAGLLFVFTIGKAFNMEPKELLPIYRFKVPPSMKFPFEVGKAVFNAPDKYGQPRDITKKASDIGKSLIGYFPAGTQIKKTVEGIQTVKDGGSYDKSGKLQYEQGKSLASKIQSILFGKYAQENAQKYFDRVDINKEEKTKIQPIYDQVKKLDEEGRGEEAQAIVDDLSDADYEIYKKIKTAEKTKKTLEGKKKMLPIYNDIQKMSDEEAQKALDSLSDEEYEYYKAIKKDRKELEKAKDGEKPEFGEAQTDENIIKTVWTYAKAIGVDPVTAFNRIFTGQKIRYVTNGVIVVERLPLSESQKIKEEQGGANPTMKLDHTIPLQLGGSNDKDNLKLVPTDEWATYTPIENAIGLAVRGNKISKKEAQELIKGFKNGDLTSEDVYLKLK